MKVYLIRRRDRRDPAFYTEDAEMVGHATSRRTRGWRVERWARGVKSVVLRAQRRAGPRMARVMGWLMRRPNPDEALLRALRGVSLIELIHPESMPPDRVRHLWYGYLRHRQRQQLGAAAWDFLMVAITAPMLIMPGPGVLAFWFLYRALTHLLAMLGTLRARSRRVSVVCESCAILDLPVAHGDDADAAYVSARCGLKGLATYLRRLEKRAPAADETGSDTLERVEASR